MNNTKKEETIDEQVYRAKVEQFAAGLQKLQEEVGIVIIPTIEFSAHGIFPRHQYVDKEQFDKQVQAYQGEASHGKGDQNQQN